jgi:hypothetical protein
MGLRKIIQMRTDRFFQKYKISEKYDKILTIDNLRVIAWVFIITRIYKIYQLVKLNI